MEIIIVAICIFGLIGVGFIAHHEGWRKGWNDARICEEKSRKQAKMTELEMMVEQHKNDIEILKNECHMKINQIKLDALNKKDKKCC